MSVVKAENEEVSIRVDHDKCVGSGECASSCPGEVYDLVDNKAVPARVDDCIECCTCVAVCPQKAISHSSCE
ncbi:4Fe-4S ferredoxin iron-sulfur binding domain protein [Desulfosarcina variabilis str. Montpellier]|uniref:4Fe-4S dicluster domain-containing protein n=1 Tax=Desulfosarcina variabilis TaxID=2300 RepID=UPI003AFB4308